MARTVSKMLPLGTEAPSFRLFDTTSGQFKSLKELSSAKPLLVMFICNHCPFVIHLHEGIKNISKFYGDEIDMIAINSNDVQAYPQDSPELMKKLFKALDLSVPYLFDETQEVAKAFEAACTPDFYLFDSDNVLVYRGQFDDSRPGNDLLVTGEDLYSAIDHVMKGEKVSQVQQPSLGCNIKWKR